MPTTPLPAPPIPYDRGAAVGYAHKWAYGRNPKYYNFENLGGDCTNFASQCLYNGTGVMNFTPTFGWYYLNVNRRAPAWTGVPFFYNFLTRKPPYGPGPVAVETGIEAMEPGDFVQLKLRPDLWSHTPVIVSVGRDPSPDNILVAAHSYDVDYRPLSSYPVMEYRFLHVLGAFPSFQPRA